MNNQIQVPSIYIFKNTSTDIGKNIIKNVLYNFPGQEIEVPIYKKNVSNIGSDIIFRYGCFSATTKSGSYPLRDFIVTGYKVSKDVVYIKICLGEIFYTSKHFVYNIVKDIKTELMFVLKDNEKQK